MFEDMKMNLWIHDIHQGIIGLSYNIKKTLFSEKSQFQKIDIVESHGLGRLLLNDGVVMFSEKDEFVYHEMVAHVPLFAHPNPERVLIIGGGDGGTAREALRHAGVKSVVMVEIDEMVVRACQEHIPSVCADMDDPRMTLLIEDGVRYMAEATETFDVIIIDSTDPIGPAKPLFDSAFYGNVRKRLNPDGILICQAESPFYDVHIQNPMLENQRPFFSKLHLYLYSNLTYPGGLWCFSFASNDICPLKNFDPERVNRSGLSMRYYNSGVHIASFMLPTFIQQLYKDVIDPLDVHALNAAAG